MKRSQIGGRYMAGQRRKWWYRIQRAMIQSEFQLLNYRWPQRIWRLVRSALLYAYLSVWLEGDQIISTVCNWKYDWKQLSKFGLQVDGKGSKSNQYWHQLDGEEPALKTPGRGAPPAAYWKTQAKAGKPQAALARAADRPKRQPGPFYPYYQQKLSCMPSRLSHTTYNLNG